MLITEPISKNDKPVFFFDNENETIIFSGNSYNNDCLDIWTNFVKKFEETIKNWDTITLNFRFTFYNTISTKFISFTLNICNQNATKKEIVINWYYPEIDTDMFEGGEDYKEVYTDIQTFNLISYKK